MEFLTSLLGDGLTGGLFGILGGLGTAWIKYKHQEKEHQYKLEENKSKREHQLKMIGAETEASIKEIEANVRRDEIIMEGKADIEESKGRNEAVVKLSENYIKDSLIERMMFNSSKITKWFTLPLALLITLIHSTIDMMRTLVRPLITYASVGFTCYVTYLTFEIYQKLGISIDSSDLLVIIKDMLKLLTFITSTAVSFWFMDKSMSRKFQDK